MTGLVLWQSFSQSYYKTVAWHKAQQLHLTGTSKSVMTNPTANLCLTYLDDYTAAAHHLAGFALAVDLAKTDPLTELLVVINLQEKPSRELYVC